MHNYSSTGDGHHSGETPTGYDLERQLQIAERRYAEARRLAERAREELRTLTGQPNARPDAVLAAQIKFDAIAARCARLYEVIDDIEERIEG